MSDPARLRQTLGQPALQRLLLRLRRRLENSRPLTGPITLANCTPAERAAVDLLLGRAASAGQSLRIDLDELAALLAEADIAPDLTTAIETLLGPVADRNAEATKLRQAWDAVFHAARQQLAPWPTLVDWLDQLVGNGTLKRLASGDPATASQLLDTLADVVAEWPARAEPLPAFAARLLGDAHALDPGTPLATLAVRAAARFGGVTPADDAEGRREAWAAVGVLCDELSTPALVFNIPLQNNSPLARLLAAAREAADPLHLSLRQLLRWPLDRDPALRDLPIFVCENPTIVALAAHRLGSRCAPLICVNGQFATPAKVLLRQLTAAGARLHYHGDFDPAGLLIARRVFDDHHAIPWRMDAADYLAAPPGIALPTDANPVSPWCPALAAAMKDRGHLVHEEAVADTLLADLDMNLIKSHIDRQKDR